MNKEKQMKKYNRFSLIIAGIFALAAGLYALFNPRQTLQTITIVTGIFLLISGIHTLIFYFSMAKGLPSTGWLLFDGVISVIVAIMFTFNSSFVVDALPILFGAWMLICGIDKAVQAFNVKKQDSKGWLSTLAIGVVCILLGITSILTPAIGSFAISMVIGICLIIYAVALFIVYNTLRKLEGFDKKTVE